MKILSEERLIELLGDFEKKIRLQIEDLDLTLSNRCSVIEFRLSKFEKRIKDLDFAYSALWNNLEDRIKKQELKLGAFITMAEVNSDFKVPCKKQTLNEYLEDLIK